jgi:glycosyltransferase involved in cell wall biosynthesis
MDGRLLFDAQTGVGTYARSLHAAMTGLFAHPILLTDRIDTAVPPRVPFEGPRRIARAAWPGMRAAIDDGRDLAGWQRFRVPDLYRLAQVYFDIHGRLLPVCIPGPPGIAHWTYPLPLHIVGWRNLYTVHDLIPLTHPGLSPIDPKRYKRLFNVIAGRAAGVVTVSSASADAVRERVPPSLPVIDCGQPVLPGARGRLPQGLRSRGYMLVVGSVEYRKNIPLIVSAYRTSGVPLPLVIAGPDGWGAEAIAGTLSHEGVVRLPFLPGDVVRSLIAEARLLVMMSRAEGFGLPVAEAMAMGTPVITTNEGALAEISGDAGVNIAPEDVSALAEAMRRLSQDEGFWSDRRTAGLMRAKAFDPERFSARIAHLYESLC